MNYLIIDLECTCDDNDEFNRAEMETIEMGAVLVNEKLEVIDTFSKFVKPVINPTLTQFCTKLTTITQADVDTAETFEVVFEELVDFCNAHGEYTFCSWGGFDYRQFRREADLKRVKNRLTKNNINLKDLFLKKTKVKAGGLSKALNHLNLKFKGTQHRGIDDALNIYEIVKVIGID